MNIILLEATALLYIIFPAISSDGAVACELAG
jgi:hypothetical protein